MNEHLIIDCQDLATEIFIIKERLGNEKDGVNDKVGYVEKYFRAAIVFDDFNTGTYTHRASVDIYDTENGGVMVAEYEEACGDSYEDALIELHNNLKNKLSKIKSLDGQVREIDGKKYKLVLVG